jgi:photosynthetic reaction center cytochrome c subunit
MKGSLVLVSVVWTLCVAAAVGAKAHAQAEHAASKLYNQSLGVNCDHCHATDDFADASKPNFDFARRMERMVLGLNEGPLRGVGSVSCWSCHRGRRTPARLPRPAWESIATAHAADFVAGRDGLGLAMSVYTASLGVDCSHCHVAGDWTAASKPAHQMVQVMAAIFNLIPTYFDKGVRMPNTQCYMCHQGHVLVERAVP